MTSLVFLIAAVGMVLQGLFITVEHNKKFVLADVLKGLAALMFVTIGLIGYIKVTNDSFGLKIVIGLVFGLVGDVLLNLRFVSEKFGQKFFLGGIVAFLVGHILYLAALAAGASPADWRFAWPTLIPDVQESSYEATVPVRLNDALAVVVSCADGADKTAWVADSFKRWFGCSPKVTGAAFAGEKLPNAEGYALEARPGRIEVRAMSAQGVCHALHTLRQIAQPVRGGMTVSGWEVPAFKVRDWPEVAWRGMHFCVFPETTLKRLEHMIRLAAYYKFNHVVVEPWGTFRSERHPWFGWPDAPLTKAEVRRLVALAKAEGVTLIPQFNCFGHASAARMRTGKHATLDFDPAHQVLFEPLGGWNWCLSNPVARTVVGELVEELYEAFGRPGSFHIGCDEAEPPSCAACCAGNYRQLVVDHVRAMVAKVKSLGARPMMWHDMLLEKGERWKPFYANGDKDEAKMVDTLPKDIVICDWYYGSDGGGGDPTGGTVVTNGYPTLDYFRGKGRDVLTCPWRNEKGIMAQGAYARKHGMFGMLETVWHHYSGTEFQRMMEAASNAAWGDGKRHVEFWTQPGLFHTFWRQVGWDMGIKDHDETGFFGKQVTRDIGGGN